MKKILRIVLMFTALLLFYNWIEEAKEIVHVEPQIEKIDISEFYSSDEQVKKDDSTNSKNVEEAEVRAMLADAEKLLKEANFRLFPRSSFITSTASNSSRFSPGSVLYFLYKDKYSK